MTYGEIATSEQHVRRCGHRNAFRSVVMQPITGMRAFGIFYVVECGRCRATWMWGCQ